MFKANSMYVYKDTSGKIKNVSLVDNNHQHIVLGASDLKEAMVKNRIEVSDLKLSSDGRLIRKYNPVSDEVQKKMAIVNKGMINRFGPMFRGNGSISYIFRRCLQAELLIGDSVNEVLDSVGPDLPWLRYIWNAMDAAGIDIGFDEATALHLDNKYFRLTDAVNKIINDQIDDLRKQGKKPYIIGRKCTNGGKMPLYVTCNLDAAKADLDIELVNGQLMFDDAPAYIEELKSKIMLPEMCS